MNTGDMLMTLFLVEEAAYKQNCYQQFWELKKSLFSLLVLITEKLYELLLNLTSHIG